MDDNTRQVLVTLVTVAGTIIAGIGGVALGRWLENRHRHDEQRRDASARFIDAAREMFDKIEEYEGEPGEFDETWLDRVGHTFNESRTMMQLVGGRRGVAAAESVRAALDSWTDPPSKKDDASSWDGRRSAAAGSIAGFVKAARKDLGFKG